MSKKSKYQPSDVTDMIFGNEESRLRIEEIVCDIEAIPSDGKSAILLYGVFGTGKTTLAKMLPNAIEFGKTGENLNLPETFIACQQGFNGPQVMTLIESHLDKVSLNISQLHYFILDEVDNLTKLAQQSLKSALNTTRGVFILTTNNVSQLDKGLLDRCILIEMNAANEEHYLPLIHKIASDSNVVLNDVDVLPTIKAANGSFRNIIHNTQRLVRRLKEAA